MKKTLRYVFQQIWYLLILLMIAAVMAIAGQAKGQLGGFFDAYLKFAVYVIVSGISAMLLGGKFPRKFHFNQFPFADYSWENEGLVYRQLFKIDAWKDLVMDVGKAGVGMTEKKITRPDVNDFFYLIQETCVAELTHALLILISPLMMLFLEGFWCCFFLIVYGLANLMYIMIQRYNRPRLVKVYHKLSLKNNS